MRRKLLRTVIVSCFACSMMTLSAYAESAVVTGSYVNLREGPGTSYRVIDCLPLGAQVTVSDRSDSFWYAVEYAGNTGYMSADFLSVNEEDHSEVTVAASTDNGNTGYINAMYVRFRSGPGSGYSIIGSFNKGKAVNITGSAGEWTACEIDGTQGYVFSQYVSYDSTPAAATAVPTDTQTPADTVTPAPTAQPVEVYDEYLDGYTGETMSAAPVPTASATPVVTAQPVETAAVQTDPVSTPQPVQTIDPTQTADPAETAGPVPTETLPPEAVPGYINANYVRFRTGPSTAYSIIDTYNYGTTMNIICISGEWVSCVINGQAGYVYSQYVSLSITDESGDSSQTDEAATTPVEETASASDGYVCGNNVRMRSGASMTSQILCELFYGNKVTITGYSGDWTAVTVDGTQGYIYSQYVKEGVLDLTVSDESGGTQSGASGEQIANFALQYVGYNYCWGGKSPDTGFDCSGLVYYVYSQFGYSLNRVAADQALNGVHVEPDELQPGDILCFYSGSSYIGHSGIYIGNGRFVHAANSSTGVIVSSLDGYYSTRGFEARRIIE